MLELNTLHHSSSSSKSRAKSAVSPAKRSKSACPYPVNCEQRNVRSCGVPSLTMHLANQLPSTPGPHLPFCNLNFNCTLPSLSTPETSCRNRRSSAASPPCSHLAASSTSRLWTLHVLTYQSLGLCIYLPTSQVLRYFSLLSAVSRMTPV